MTVPVPVAGVPMLLATAPPLTITPSTALGTAAVPAAFVPIRLPASVLKLVRSPTLSIPLIQTPLWPLPEMTLPFPAWPMELRIGPAQQGDAVQDVAQGSRAGLVDADVIADDDVLRRVHIGNAECRTTGC